MSDYNFSQQQKDFLKLQFKYLTKLKARLAEGTITQEYFDNHLWLVQQQLESPTAGFWDEFKTAVDECDLAWLAATVGESVEAVAEFVGTTAGKAVGTIVSGVTSGVAGSLGVTGWIFALGVVGVIVWAFWKGPLSKLQITKLPVP